MVEFRLHKTDGRWTTFILNIEIARLKMYVLQAKSTVLEGR